MYRGLHNLIYSTPYCDSRKELSDWLKSLKDRYTWKPTEVQVVCLQDAINDYHRRGYKAETLETLFKQLKQL